MGPAAAGKFRRLGLAAALVAICGAAVSCVSDSVTYIIEINPTGSGLERRITAYSIGGPDTARTRVGPSLRAEEANRLERVYGVRPDTAATYVAHGRFSTIPNDIDNWGMLRRFESTLGTAWLYAERVRGNPNPLAQAEAQLGAADSLADIVLGWMKAELGQNPKWEALRSFLDRDFRRQLRSFVLRTWRSDPMPIEELEVAFLEQPALAGLLYAGKSGDDDDAVLLKGATLGEVRDLVGRVMGLHSREETEKVLRFLSDPDSADESLLRYISGETGETPEIASARWNGLAVRALVSTASFLEEPTTDSIVIHLSVPRGSVGMDTNGEWDENAHRVVWSGRIQAPGDSSAAAPLACYALWAVPDSTRQARLFGDSSLDADDLIRYCVWFETLSEARQSEWNRMLGKLRPGRLKVLEEFKFSAQAEAGEILGRKLILAAVRPPQIGPRRAP